MITTDEVIKQFYRLGVKPSFWARAEIKELANILASDEQLTHVVFGWYDNGLALLCCTDYRVLLIDKKPFFLKMEDLRYDKISEVKFLYRLLDCSIVLSYAGMKLEFRSWNQGAMRKLIDYVQETITMINRQQWHTEEHPQQPVRPVPQQSTNSVSVPAPGPKSSGAPELATASRFDMTAYPEELMQRANIDLGLMKNPYASTQKFMRRRVPHLGFNQTSR